MLTVLGLAAGALTTACWLPQVGRSWRTRQVGDVSWGFLVTVGSGVGLWLAYGLVADDASIVIANCLSLVAITTLAGLKATFDRQGGHRADQSLHDVGAVLLDMDGTLVDSDAAVARTWASWARQHGLDARLVVDRAQGRPAVATLREAAPHLTDAEIADAARALSDAQRADLADVVALPGATALLEAVSTRCLPWAIVTSADRRLAAAQLDAVGISPPLLVTADDVAHGKPHPEGYLTAAAILGVDPSVCLVVEDSLAGITAGHAAGMRVAALRGLRGDLTITSLNQLAQKL